MSDPKRWIIVEMRNGNVHNLLVDATFDRTTSGDWLPYYKKLATGEIKHEAHGERGLNTPKAVTGQPTPTFGPILQPIEGVNVYSDERAIRLSDVVDVSEASDYWSGCCDKAYEQDMKAWKSALSKIVTANVSSIRDIAKMPGNGVRLPKLPE